MRCAIYTRKSTEEGLAQKFNSLDAQRESGEAYILSQRQAGWIVLPERYDDGGYTGANLERPGLRRLQTDIAAGRVDCVVVYKVDRLSRSLLDFARLMGEFDERGISLVSVTQQFNTTASMGRLTLNILLSFAQFERELIAERTRDKMSASRRKGKWVGGIPPLGYDVAAGGGRLIVNEEEAQQVRAIFALYLKDGGLIPVLIEVQKQKWTTKHWTTKSGILRRGKPLIGGDLIRMLSNPVYAGKVHCEGQSYAGDHAAIVEERAWQQVQGMLSRDGRPARPASRMRQPPPGPMDLSQPDGYLDGDVPELENAAMRLVGMLAGTPRITRLLALAVKFDGLIQQGIIKDYAELARLGQISRARVTQIMNLLNLAPDIQEEILSWADVRSSKQHIREASVRKMSSEVLWTRQREQWKNCGGRCGDPSHEYAVSSKMRI
jgi:DNA invertase Pin-like site-specific DNA recombinase